MLARERWVERMGALCGSGLGRLYRGEVRTPASGSSEVGGGRQRRESGKRPSARRPGSRLEAGVDRRGQGTMVIPWLLTFPGQLKA